MVGTQHLHGWAARQGHRRAEGQGREATSEKISGHSAGEREWGCREPDPQNANLGTEPGLRGHTLWVLIWGAAGARWWDTWGHWVVREAPGLSLLISGAFALLSRPPGLHGNVCSVWPDLSNFQRSWEFGRLWKV